MRFVIIGGDAAGMSAASRAKRIDPNLDLVVLEATNDVSYSACGMPYNLADPTRDMSELVVRQAAVFREKQGIDVRLGHLAQDIDRTAKKVMGSTSGGETFEVAYDNLLIATGARARRLDVPGNSLPGVQVLKSLADGRAIKAYLKDHSVHSVLIVGIGYIGLEMAEAFHCLGIKVTMTKPRPRILPWMPEKMAQVVVDELQDKEIGLHLGVRLRAVEQAEEGLVARFDDGEIAVDMVLMGLGVVPNSEIAANAGLELGPDNAIAVDKTLRTSDPAIFAAGDCADAFHVVTGRRVWMPLALRANRAGWAVADNVTGGHVALPGIVGSQVFKLLDLEVARSGLSADEARNAGFDPVETYISSRSRAHAHPGNQTLHVNMVADKSVRPTSRCVPGRKGRRCSSY